MAKKQVNKGGRPTDFTKETVNKLEQAFAIDCSVEEACSYAEISRQAFYDWIKKNPVFADRIADLRERPVLAARQRAVKGINETYGNAMDYLKQKRRDEFGDEQKHDVEITLKLNI